MIHHHCLGLRLQLLASDIGGEFGSMSTFWSYLKLLIYFSTFDVNGKLKLPNFHYFNRK